MNNWITATIISATVITIAAFGKEALSHKEALIRMKSIKKVNAIAITEYLIKKFLKSTAIPYLAFIGSLSQFLPMLKDLSGTAVFSLVFIKALVYLSVVIASAVYFLLSVYFKMRKYL
ncbi:MAG: hypothetical protein ACM3P0_18095 [Acidobacteriota bacterium]